MVNFRKDRNRSNPNRTRKQKQIELNATKFIVTNNRLPKSTIEEEAVERKKIPKLSAISRTPFSENFLSSEFLFRSESSLATYMSNKIVIRTTITLSVELTFYLISLVLKFPVFTPLQSTEVPLVKSKLLVIPVSSTLGSNI